MREWVAKFQYPGKRLCYFGTVRAETEMQAEQLARKRWKETLPFDPPNVFTMIPGSIILQLNEED
jgi:hypothetical protein